MSNDFLVFGGAGGANVIDQATYAAMAARLAGFSSGVAQSAQLNKVWRQSSIMSAVLAQFIADLTGQNAVDDGTVATLLANLKAAVSAQSIGLVGSMRNGKMSVTTASATATFTADEVIVETALGGQTYRLPNFNKPINLAATGVGGMDAGAAPSSGYIALYAIYNPGTGASALLAKNATSALQPEVYGGVSMPAGYTASALIGVWPTNASGQFVVGIQNGRKVTTQFLSAFSTSSQTSTGAYATASVTAVPMNAKRCDGLLVITPTATAYSALGVASNAGSNAIGIKQYYAYVTAGAISECPFSGLDILAPQSLAYTFSGAAGTFSFGITAYEF